MRTGRLASPEVPYVLVVSGSSTNRLGLPRVPRLPPNRMVVVSRWDRAVNRAASERVSVVVTDSFTFMQDLEAAQDALQIIDADLVLIVGLPSLTSWARELRCETTSRSSYGARLIDALSRWPSNAARP